MYFLFNEQLRDSGLPADVLVDELKKDIYLCASPGHYRISDYSPHAAQRAVEDELAFIEAGWEIYEDVLTSSYCTGYAFSLVCVLYVNTRR